MAPQRELTTEDYIGMLRRKWPIIAVLAVVGCGAGIGASQFLPKRYTSETVVLVEQPTVPGDIVKPVVNTDTNVRLATMQEEILSRSRIEPIINKLGLFKPDVDRVPIVDLIARLKKSIDVTPVQPMARTNSPGLPGFSISVTLEDPKIAQQVCSTVTGMFLEENLRVRQHQAETTTGFLSSQLDGAKAKLDEQDARLAAFQRSHMGTLPDDQNANLNVLQGLATQLDAATQALGRAQQDKTAAESTLAEERTAWQATLKGPNPETYEQQITALEAQLTAMRLRYTDDYPDAARLKREIAAVRKMAEASQQTQKAAGPETTAKAPVEPPQILALRAQVRQFDQVIQDRTAQQEDLQRRIKIFQERVESSPTIEQEYKALTRDYQTALDFYNALLKNRDLAQMATDLERQQQSEQFRVLDPANLPDRPSFPDPLIFSAGGLGGGLALGIGLTLLLEMRDTSVRTEREIEALLHLPVLAVVPTLEPQPASGPVSLSMETVARS